MSDHRNPKLSAQPEIELTYIDIAKVKPDPQNARKHPKRQLAQLRASIKEHSFTNPILVDEHFQLIAGHARVEAAKEEGLTRLPCVIASGLTATQKKTLALADNRIAELAIWDEDILRQTLIELVDAEVNIEVTGFLTAEVDIIIDDGSQAKQAGDPDDELPELDPNALTVSRLGDLWQLGEHRLYCGNSLEAQSYDVVLGGEKAQQIITDPPFNVMISSISGLGRTRHREFQMASGEMSKQEFTEFLAAIFLLCVAASVDGSIHHIFSDWKHVGEMTVAGDRAYTELKALCVWNKTNAGMGSLYRSKHELIFVRKNGTAPHINNIELGKHGRYRTNVIDYAGGNSFHKGRAEELAMHPTVKPTGLIADLMRDCSKVGGLVLDPFGGSGTTIIAAQRTRRRAAVIEIDPLYVDVAVRRWEARTGKQAILAATGQAFTEVAAERRAAVAPQNEGEARHD